MELGDVAEPIQTTTFYKPAQDEIIQEFEPIERGTVDLKVLTCFRLRTNGNDQIICEERLDYRVTNHTDEEDYASEPSKSILNVINSLGQFLTNVIYLIYNLINGFGRPVILGLSFLELSSLINVLFGGK